MGPGRITRLLRQVEDGGEEARAELLELLHDDLRRIAAAQMRGQLSRHTLQPTALVHEAYLRLFAGEVPSYQDRAHFLAAAARAMRSELVDAARRHAARKRGGGRWRCTLTEATPQSPQEDYDLLDVHEALARLERIDPLWFQV